MPYVNIKVTREAGMTGQGAVTTEQKAALIRGVSQLLLDVLGKPLASTFVVIDEIDLENWGAGGISVKEARAKAERQQAPTAP